MRQLTSFFSQTLYYGFSSVFARIINFVLVPLYTLVLPTEEFGSVAIFYSALIFIMTISSLGMEAAFFRFINKEENKKKVYSTAAWILIFSAFSVLFLGQIISDNIPKNNQYSEHIIWMILIVFLDTLIVLPYAKLRQEERPKKFAIIKVIQTTVNIFFNSFFLIICPWLLEFSSFEWVNFLYTPEIGIGYIFIANLLASGTALIILSRDIFKNLKWKYFDFGLAKKMLTYSFPLIIAGLAYATNEVADKWFLMWFSKENPLQQVGVYSACYKLSIFMVLFVQAYRYAAEPYYFNNYKKDDFKKTYILIMRYFIAIALFIFLAISLNKEYIASLFLWDADYWVGVGVVPIVLIGHLFLGIYYNLSLWYKLTNKTNYGAILSIGGAIITIVLNILLIPKIGYLGSAWATLCCYFFMALMSYILSKKHYPIQYEKRKTTLYFIVAISIYLCAYCFEINNITLHLGYKAILIILYILVVVLCEKSTLKKLYESSKL